MNTVLLVLIFLYSLSSTTLIISTSTIPAFPPPNADPKVPKVVPKLEGLNNNQKERLSFSQLFNETKTRSFELYLEYLLSSFTEVKSIELFAAKEGPELQVKLSLDLYCWRYLFVEPPQFQPLKFTLYFNDLPWIQAHIEITELPSYMIQTRTHVLLRFVFLNHPDLASSFTEASDLLWSANPKLTKLKKFSFAVGDLWYGTRSAFSSYMIHVPIAKWYSFFKQLTNQPHSQEQTTVFQTLYNVLDEIRKYLDIAFANKFYLNFPKHIRLLIPLSSLSINFSTFDTTQPDPINFSMDAIQKTGLVKPMGFKLYASKDWIAVSGRMGYIQYISNVQLSINHQKISYLKNVKFQFSLSSLTKL